MTRRVSKRAMLHQLDDFPVVRIHLDNLRSSSAQVVVDGVPCALSFPRKARHELLRESGVHGYVETIPDAIGDGTMPPGSRSGDWARGLRRNHAARPTIKVFDDFTEQADGAFLRYQATHPIGSIVTGQVRLVNRRVRIPVNVTTDSGNVTGNSDERDRWVGVARFNFMPSCFFG